MEQRGKGGREEGRRGGNKGGEEENQNGPKYLIRCEEKKIGQRQRMNTGFITEISTFVESKST